MNAPLRIVDLIYLGGTDLICYLIYSISIVIWRQPDLYIQFGI